ncbi:hypothetical protein PYCC9005_002275 [Savitreella phatthalungensis]
MLTRLLPVGRLGSCRRTYSSYGFVGLGRMGMGMAINLRKKVEPSSEVIVYDTNPAALEEISKHTRNVTIASSLKQIGSKADCIITMLPDTSHVEACYFGDEGFCFDQPGLETGLSDSQKTDRLFVDCSTIDPFRSRDIASRLSETSTGTFVDAPVSGGVKGANDGTLTFMVGMSPEHSLRQKLEVLLGHMGKSIHLCGGQGAGLSAKLVNNYMLALHNIATAEGMNLGLRLGLPAETLAGVINSSTGKCWPSLSNNPVEGVTENAPCTRDFDGGFGTQLMKKDLSLAIKAAEGCGAFLGAKDYASKLYDTAASDDKMKNKDFGVIYKLISSWSDESKRQS